MKAFASRVSWLTPLMFLGACVIGDGRPRSGPNGVCGDLAYVFYVVAEKKNRGVSRAVQLADVGTDNTQTRDDWENIVELVYRYEGSPEEVSSAVLDNCVVNRQGQAVVRTLWPQDPL